MKRVVFLLLFCLLITGCSGKGNIETILDTDLPGCVLIKEINTHGGFLGDGELFAKLDCSKEKINFTEWKELPLSDNIKTIFEMEMCDSFGCKNAYDRYEIPNIEEGYYYFYDRHFEAKNRFDDTNLNDRASYNYSLVLYDKSNNMMYYYELDT